MEKRKGPSTPKFHSRRVLELQSRVAEPMIGEDACATIVQNHFHPLNKSDEKKKQKKKEISQKIWDLPSASKIAPTKFFDAVRKMPQLSI